MRIGYICLDAGVPVFGSKGCSIHVQEMLRAMVNAGHEVELFTNRIEGAVPDDLQDIRVHPLASIRSGQPRERELAARAQNAELGQRLHEAGNFDLIYERHSLWCHAAMEHAAGCGVPGVLEVNAPLIEEQRDHRQLTDPAAAAAAAVRAFNAARTIIAVSSAVAAYARKHAPEHPAIHVEPNGVNAERFSRRLVHRPADQSLTIGFVGTLKPWHGVEFLLKAFAQAQPQLSTARLLIVGDGPERERLETTANQLAIGAITEFTGTVSPAQIPRLLAGMDIAVAPYPSLANFYFSPLKVLEYMAAGRAIVASRIGQLGDWIEGGVSGVLVKPGDVRALAKALVELMHDADKRGRLGAAARQNALERHSWSAVLDRILSHVHRHDRQPAPIAAR